MVDSKYQWKAWLYLLPAIILLLIFTVWPIINTVRMAFTVYWDPYAPVYLDEYDEYGQQKVMYGKYVGYNIAADIGNDKKEDGDPTKFSYEFGLDNFKTVLNYDGFWVIMRNTVLLCVLTVPLSTFLALLIAVCLNAIKPLRRFLQTIFFLPYVTNSIAIGMAFPPAQGRFPLR